MLCYPLYMVLQNLAISLFNNSNETPSHMVYLIYGLRWYLTILTWGINKIDLVVIPVVSDCSRVDCDASVPLLHHVIHYCVTTINIT